MSAKSLGFCFDEKKLKQNIKLLLSTQTETKRFPCLRTTHSFDVVSNMRKTFQILVIFLIFSCSEQKYKTIDFDRFEITVPENWNKYERNGIDSYVGGIITDKKDTLKFDFGRYSADISTDFPMVYNQETLAELTKKERELLPNTKHLITEDWSNIDLRDYLKYGVEYDTIACFRAKIITPTNKGYGGTGIYIDSLTGGGEDNNKIGIGFYGWYLNKETHAEFIKALKTLRFEKYCSQQNL